MQDHHGHCLGSAAAVLKELKEAIDRRGMSDAEFWEIFVLQKQDRGQWGDVTIANIFEALTDGFARQVAANPAAEWRIIVRHSIRVETMLVTFSQEKRG